MLMTTWNCPVMGGFSLNLDWFLNWLVGNLTSLSLWYTFPFIYLFRPSDHPNWSLWFDVTLSHWCDVTVGHTFDVTLRIFDVTLIEAPDAGASVAMIWCHTSGWCLGSGATCCLPPATGAAWWWAGSPPPSMLTRPCQASEPTVKHGSCKNSSKRDFLKLWN